MSQISHDPSQDLLPTEIVDAALEEAAHVAVASDEKITVTSPIILDPDDFIPDLEANLGRANGNCYQRRAGVEGVHDGQIAVRLKKKRFILLDYGIRLTPLDLQAAALAPHHIKIPEGAGERKCTMGHCSKVGVPVCLYDSEPDEPDSLYLRSGMCFTCQRSLNEKRRTERKRPPQRNSNNGNPETPSLIYAIGPSKRFKLNGSIIQLNSDAVIINGPIEGTKSYGEGYGFQEIGADLQQLAYEAAADVDKLLRAISGNSATAAVVAAGAVVKDEQQEDLQPEAGLLNTSSQSILSLPQLAPAIETTGITANTTEEQKIPEENSSTNDTLSESNENHVSFSSAPIITEAICSDSNGHDGTSANNGDAPLSPSSEDITALCERAFKSLNKSIFLLSQWKASWDAVVAAARETVTDSTLADAVASAAAVAAAAVDGQDQGTDNMASLLMAAGDKREQIFLEETETII